MVLRRELLKTEGSLLPVPKKKAALNLTTFWKLNEWACDFIILFEILIKTQ